MLPPAPLIHSGKVRDSYQLDDGHLLMVSSDRLSAFDVVLPTAIPGKGIVLTQLSRFWFGQTAGLIGNHLTSRRVSDLGWSAELTDALEARSMIVRTAARIPVECVIRGYLAGSGWSEYRETGQIAGHSLPAGLTIGSQLPQPIFTPARKHDTGHDQPITVPQLRSDIGTEQADRLESISLAIYQLAADLSRQRGVIVADTKFEFGFIDGQLCLIDELLTPDSSRFWDLATWQPGQEPMSWDKQFVRNWLLITDWDREPPGPALPPEIAAETTARYLEAYERITGLKLLERDSGPRQGVPA
jgi:phosphoribosylaminoimidazole-succinocarboxamide synthase